MAVTVQPPSSSQFFVVAISDTSPHPSDAQQILQYNYAGLQLSTTGNLVGSWLIEVSNDLGATWAPITSAFSPTFSAVASSPNSQFGQCLPIIAQLLRVTFTASSGSGTAKAALCRKGSSN